MNNETAARQPAPAQQQHATNAWAAHRRRLGRYAPGLLGAALIVGFVVLGVLAPYLPLQDPLQMNVADRLQPPNAKHPLGTDHYGRDMLSRLIHGTRPSLAIAFLAVGVGTVLGTGLGATAGYLGGRVDTLVSRSMDVLMSFPAILLGMALVAAFGAGLVNLVCVIALVRLPAMVRIARGQALTVRELEYVEASQALGASPWRIIRRDILPNIASPVIAVASLSMATAILLEASFGFLGLGVQPPTPSWGNILAEGREYMRVAPHIISLAGLSVSLLALGFNLIGDALRDALDPRMRRYL